MEFGLKIGFSLRDKLGSYSEATLKMFEERIETSILDYCFDEDLTYAQSLVYDDSFLVNIYPEEKEVLFYSTEDQYFICDATTSAAGPGFHAFLIGMLKELENIHNIQWIWHETEHDFFCDGSYHLDFDILKLQQDMCQLLQNTARHIIDENLTNLRLSLPIDCHVMHSHFAASPMGFWERDFFETLAQESIASEKAMNLCETFFPWWRPEKDALFWFNLGTCLMNVSVPWRPMHNKYDQGFLYCVLALRAFEVAKQLDPTLAYPEDEIQELDLLLNKAPLFKEDPIPDMNKIGFRRLNILHHLPCNWCIELPGFFHQAVDDTPLEDASETMPLIFYYNDILIECRIYRINLRAGEEISDYVYHNSEHELIDDFKERGFVSVITKHEEIASNGKQYTYLNAEYGYEKNAMIVTASYPYISPENTEDAGMYDWVFSMLQSIYPEYFFSEEEKALN